MCLQGKEDEEPQSLVPGKCRTVAFKVTKLAMHGLFCLCARTSKCRLSTGGPQAGGSGEEVAGGVMDSPGLAKTEARDA